MISNGWHLRAHPSFAEQYAKLLDRVRALHASDPGNARSHPTARLLDTVNGYIKEVIPRDPGAAEFRQGNTPGKENRHWRRAKFHGRYRLFFRFSTKHKTIIYAWINDESTLRKAGAKSDPYAVFAAMLKRRRSSGLF